MRVMLLLGCPCPVFLLLLLYLMCCVICLSSFPAPLMPAVFDSNQLFSIDVSRGSSLTVGSLNLLSCSRRFLILVIHSGHLLGRMCLISSSIPAL